MCIGPFNLTLPFSEYLQEAPENTCHFFLKNALRPQGAAEYFNNFCFYRYCNNVDVQPDL